MVEFNHHEVDIECQTSSHIFRVKSTSSELISSSHLFPHKDKNVFAGSLTANK